MFYALVVTDFILIILISLKTKKAYHRKMVSLFLESRSYTFSTICGGLQKHDDDGCEDLRS